jgi:hypothetical protein
VSDTTVEISPDGLAKHRGFERTGEKAPLFALGVVVTGALTTLAWSGFLGWGVGKLLGFW